MVRVEGLTLALLLLLPGAASQFASCVEKLWDHDKDRNAILSETDYQAFILDLSEERIVVDMGSSVRSTIHQAFDARVDEQLGGMDISAAAHVSGGDLALEEFCGSAYQAFFPLFEVTIAEAACTTALAAVTAADEHISQAAFVSVVNHLSGLDSGRDAASFLELGRATRDVFTDFVGFGDTIEHSLLTSRPGFETFFCRRVVLGTQLDDRGPPTASRAASTLAAAMTPLLGRKLQEITEIQYQQCKISMGVVDRLRDDRLDEVEFVAYINRFTDTAFPNTVFAVLPAVFRNLYLSGAGDDGTIVTEGAGPGSEASATQLQFLRDFCTSTYFAVSVWEGGNVAAPTSAPTAAATPVPGPTITDLEFALCTISLAVADEDRDDLMTGNEYVLFLNDRFLDDLYVDQPFTAIDEIFVTSFNGFVAPSGTIDISGVQPGDARTPAQNTALRAICVDSYQVAAIFLSNSRTPTKSPIAATSPPTMVPTSQPTLSLDPADFQQCRAALLLADSDSDDLLSEAEYLVFVNQSTGGSSQTFSALDPILREPFDVSKRASDSVSVVGSSPSDNPTEQQTQQLRSFCALAFNAIDEFRNPSPPTQSPTRIDLVGNPELQSCLALLSSVDANTNSLVEQTEYVVFVNTLADDNNAFGPSFTNFPYVLRDNFQWISEDSAAVDIAGVEDAGQLSGTDLSRIARLCSRTNSTVISAQQGNSEVTLVNHCYDSFTSGDADKNNLLSDVEFARTVGFFQGVENQETPFEGLDDAFKTYFVTNKGSSNNQISIEGSKPDETPTQGQRLLLDFLCVQLETAVSQARASSLFLTRCLDALGLANGDANDLLSESEYVNFVFQYGGRSPGDETFANLPASLQANFVTLRGAQAEINIAGWQGEFASTAERENIESVCSATEVVLDDLPTLAPTLAPTATPQGPTTLTIFNGFLVGNKEGVDANGLRNADISDLEDAYTAFVNATVNAQLENRRLRGRRMAVVGVTVSSPRVYQILDGICPSSFTGDEPACQDAYGSFQLELSDSEDMGTIEQQYTNLTQDGIADGSLQLQLKSTSPDSGMEILGATESNKPGSRAPSSTPGPTAAPRDGGGGPSRNSDSGGGLTIIIAIGVIILLLAAIGGCCFCFFQRRRRKRDDSFDGVHQHGGGHIGERPVERTGSEGDGSIYDEIVPEGSPGGKSLLPISDHSNEENFQFRSRVPKTGQQRRYSDQGRPNLDTVPDGDEEETDESSAAPSGAWSADGNPWGADGAPKDMLGTSQSETDSSEESEELVEKDLHMSGTMGAQSVRSTGRSTSSGEGLREPSGHEVPKEPEEFEDHRPELDGSESEEEESEFEDELDEESALNDSSYLSQASEDRSRLEDYREEIEELVRQVVPDEIENIDAMINQFQGRERELINTLRNMADQGTTIEASDDEDSEEETGSYEDEDGEEDGSEEEGSGEEMEEETEDEDGEEDGEEEEGSGEEMEEETEYEEEEYEDEYEEEEVGEEEEASGSYDSEYEDGSDEYEDQSSFEEE